MNQHGFCPGEVQGMCVGGGGKGDKHEDKSSPHKYSWGPKDKTPMGTQGKNGLLPQALDRAVWRRLRAPWALQTVGPSPGEYRVGILSHPQGLFYDFS